MRRKELSMWGHRKAWRQICVEFTQFWKTSIRHCTPTWNEVPVLIFRLHTSGGITTRWEMKCTFPYQVQLPSPSSPLASCFTPVFVLFLLLLLFMSPFWGRGLGKDKVLAFPLWPGIQVSSPPQWTGSREQRDPSNQGVKRSRQGGGC